MRRLSRSEGEVPDSVANPRTLGGPGPQPPESPLEPGEPVLVMGPRGSVLLVLAVGPQEVPRVGVVDLSEVVGKPPGTSVEWAGGTYRVVRPVLADFMQHLTRTTQIITPKDGLHLAFLAGVGPGSIVLEAGCGTGSLTTILAYAVGPAGRVIAYDRREEFLAGARSNLERFGLAVRVDFRLRDVVAEGFGNVSAPSAVLDLPEPWNVVRSVQAVLGSGGRIAAFTPTYNQLERTVRSLREAGFTEVRALELLERPLHVGEGGTRPEFDMLGHTGFLIGARRGD